MERLPDHEVDSPSRQLLWELSRLSIQKVQEARDEVDKQAEELQSEYRKSIAAANAHHRQVYESALNELEAETLRQKIVAERRRQNEKEKLIALRKEEAERLRREEERLLRDARAVEAAEKAAEEQRRQREAEEMRLRQAREMRESMEAERKKAAEKKSQEEKLATEAKAKQAALEALKAKQQISDPAGAPAVPEQSPPSVSQVAAPVEINANIQGPIQNSREAEHQRYLQIHKSLKRLRSYMKDQVKRPEMKEVKTIMSEGRRTIQKCVSQLVGDSSMNKRPQLEILNVLKSGLAYPHPQVDVTDYLLQPPSNIPDKNGPGLLLYFFNILAKRLIRQYLDEAAIKPKAADPVGVLGASMFGQADLLWNGTSLIDILIAKFHVVCPVLFGIYGPDNTTPGKLRLGWHREDGVFCTPQRQNERMTGLGAGYSSIALRNFDNARGNNPYPPWKFWQALSNIVNVPPDSITETHMVVLKALIENSEQRILHFFGNAGKAALRITTMDFPNRAPAKVREGSAARGLMLLPDLWKRDLKLYI